MPEDAATEIRRVLAHYDLGELLRLDRDRRGTVNTSYHIETLKNGRERKLFLRRYKAGIKQEEILFEHSIITHVAGSAGCPVAAVHKTTGGETYLYVEGTDAHPEGAYYAVFDFLPGEDRYSWVGPHLTLAELRNAGALLARFHRAASGLIPKGRRVEPKISELLGQIETLWAEAPSHSKGTRFDAYLARNLALVSRNITRTRKAIAGALRLLPEGIIHSDYHPGNLKFVGDEISGLVDFDWSKVDLRAFDVALAIWYFCVSWEGASDGRLRLGEAMEFLTAYQGQLHGDAAFPSLSRAEIRLLPALLDAANIYVLFWTLRDYYGKPVDPEEFLVYLKHGVRFVRRSASRSNRDRFAKRCAAVEAA
jgi:homoserine kinase type II